MVVKNPFLSEKDHDLQFIVRNEGLFRGLGTLFPAANLATLTSITIVCSENKLFTGKYIHGVKYRGKKRLRSVLSHATKTLTDKLGDRITPSSYQRYLDLCCDMRILKSMPTEYIVHSYGLALVALHHLRTWRIKGFWSDIAWKCYIIDRLLFEDGDYIKAVLRLIRDKSNEISSKELGIEMHDMVFSELERRIEELKPPYVIRKYIENKILNYKKTRNREDRTLRRTELEYTVRRDWLRELGLSIIQENQEHLSQQGYRLAENILDEPLTLDFFIRHFFSTMKVVFNLNEQRNLDIEKLFKSIYNQLSGDKITVVETLALIDTTILSQLPTYIGERESLLLKLNELSTSDHINLVLESGYRTKDYYVNARV